MRFVILVHLGQRVSGMAGQCETSSIQTKVEVSEKASHSSNLSCSLFSYPSFCVCGFNWFHIPVMANPVKEIRPTHFQ